MNKLVIPALSLIALVGCSAPVEAQTVPTVTAVSTVTATATVSAAPKETVPQQCLDALTNTEELSQVIVKILELDSKHMDADEAYFNDLSVEAMVDYIDALQAHNEDLKVYSEEVGVIVTNYRQNATACKNAAR